MGAAIGEGMQTSGAFLLGRVLYSEWSECWAGQERTEPAQAEEAADDFGTFINAHPEYVVSNTLTEATWNNTMIVSGDVASQLRDVESSTDGDITMSGSATTVRWLLANGLLDELNLMVQPVAVGHGQRLFEDGVTHPLELLRHTVLGTGVVWLTYAPAG